MSDRIDEMSNEDLAAKGHSEHWLRIELDRIDTLVLRLITTGADLSYFNERRTILRKLLRENSRNVLL